MFFSALVWAWVIANIVSIVATMNEATNEHLQTLDCIKELLTEFGKDEDHLGRRLREYFTKVRDVQEYDFISGVIQRLSPALKLEVVHAIHDVWITKIWWLNKVPDTSEFMVELTLRMTTSLHAPNELIPNKQELCVILQGLCIHGGCLKSRGQIFGEDMLLNNEALRKPFASLAMTYLHMFVLTRRLLNSLVLKYPDAAVAIRRSYVQFAVIRGMLFKAELFKRRQKLARHRDGLVALDRGTFQKPRGDAEDVIGDQGGGSDLVHDIWSANIGDETSALGPRPNSAAVQARMSRRHSRQISHFEPVIGEESALPETAADLLVGHGEAHLDDTGYVGGAAGVSAEELKKLTKCRDDLCSRLRARASTLEAAAKSLLEQAEILDDY